MRKLLKLLLLFLPWPIRRKCLESFFQYRIHPTARIGFSWFYPRHLEMAEESYVGHLNVAVNLERIVMGRHSSIGRRNWITGYPKESLNGHFRHLLERDPSLYLGAHSAVTKNHHLDCTATITIGTFTTVAGYYSQFLTHSIDLVNNRQDAAPIEIGDYTFVSTNVVVLGGSVLPSRSVLGAKALLNKPMADSYRLYAGVPAKPVKELPKDAGYFGRESGFVV